MLVGVFDGVSVGVLVAVAVFDGVGVGLGCGWQWAKVSIWYGIPPPIGV